jgi:hypothetical protein
MKPPSGKSKAGSTRVARHGLLADTRVYLSGPMDFVASRENEMKYGWRTRVSQFVAALGVTVFDPWHKPSVRGFYEYGREGVDTSGPRSNWRFESGAKGAKARAACSGKFWESLHIDLRMVDTSDFVIAYCPTNVYSVGTPHEIIQCRQQRKPVLFVSPAVEFPALSRIRAHLAGDETGSALLEELVNQVPIKENPEGIPSLWYMPLVGTESFFDGFGFAPFRKEFGWTSQTPLDDVEQRRPPRRPLLAFLRALDKKLPQKWDNRTKRFVRNDDWLLWDLKEMKRSPTEVLGSRKKS